MTDVDDALRWLARGLQAGLVLIVGYALIAVDLSLVVNSAIPLALTAVPAALSHRHGHELSGGLVLWIAAAALIHAVGALGPYETIGWYDQVAHAVSAALVAGVGYAIVAAVDRDHDRIVVPPRLRVVFVVVFVLAVGVLWEIGEFAAGGLASVVGGQPVLAQYGLDDVVLDLLFDAVGGLVVGLWGTQYFQGMAGLLADGQPRGREGG